MLKLPNEPDVYDFKPLGSPIRKKDPEEVKESTWTATSRPGVEINSEGKLRTNIPENENPSWHASQPIPDKKNSSSKIEHTIKWTPELEKEFRERKGQFKQDYENSVLGTPFDSPTKEARISELSQQRNFSTPQRSGKSLIEEMYSRYGNEILFSQSSQEPQKLSGSRPQAVVIDDLQIDTRELDWLSWINDK